MASQPSNAAIAEALEELGDLYELDGAIVHRVVAYRSAGKAVREASVSVAALAVEGRATELPGIGKTLQEKIQALTLTGEIPAAVKLRAKFPAGLVALTRLPGLGPKRARLLHSELGIDSPEALEEAARAQRLMAGRERLGGPGTHVELAGSARRRADSVKDLDMAACTTSPTAPPATMRRCARRPSGGACMSPSTGSSTTR